MTAFINGIGTISPQNTFGDVSFLQDPKEYNSNRLACIEPEYTGWIDARAIRRMSRIIRMGVASAGLALKEAGLEKPDAIITGTAFGCLEDTGIFLAKIVDNKEEALNPTPFIQSTHNTIGSQVALLLQCYGYNQTYSHRAFSFEHALQDALMTIGEKQNNVLVGGVDEITNLSFDILDRFGMYKKNNTSNLKLFHDKSAGCIQGEGASYFLLAGKKTNSTYASVRDVATFYRPEDVYKNVSGFLAGQSLRTEDIQLILTGKNGDFPHDQGYQDFIQDVFSGASTGVYKHLSGEYQTSGAFALWVAARILKENKIPPVVLERDAGHKEIKRILLYNKYLGKHHSFILLESC